MFTARTTTSTSKAVAGDTTKDDLIKEVRARKYRGGGIRLSDKDIFNPRYTFRKAVIKHGSINRKLAKVEVSKQIKEIKCISPKDKILRKIMQTKDEFYRNVENSVRRSIKISLGGIRGVSGPLGPSLKKCKVGQDEVEKAEASQFLILHPFPVKKMIVLKLHHKVDTVTGEYPRILK